MSSSAFADFDLPFAKARWIDVVTRRAACPRLAPTDLLHAGPPFRGAPPEPVLNAAVQAVLFENLAADAAEARELIAQGRVALHPAQDFRIATPLAQVVSASMLLFAVEQQHEICYAPMIEGAAPALRFGSAAPECRQRLREVVAWAENHLADLVRRAPVALDALIRTALAAGDECHARTAVANEALVRSLSGLAAGDAERLRALPAFVLPLLMAAACTAMRVACCDIETIGGNGVDFGVRRRGEQTWRRVPAQAPKGPRVAGAAAAKALGAIGDSAVIDFCGLGGQADAVARRRCLIDPRTGIVDAAAVARHGHSPLINLAILDAEVGGLIGRGVYCPPVGLFLTAG